MDWKPSATRQSNIRIGRAARMAALLIGVCAAPAAHAQQYGPQFYYPPNQPQPYYPAYQQQAPVYYSASQSPAIPQQYPRIYGPLTSSPQSSPIIRESAAPPPPAAMLPSTLIYEDAPPPVQYREAPNAAPSWPAARTSQPAMEMPAPIAPAVAIPFHRPTNKETGWITADYLLSVSKSMQPTTPLVTTSLPNIARAGSLGQAETAPLYGAQSIDFGLISGVRLNVGCYLGCDNQFSVESDLLWRGSSNPSFFAASDSNGYPIIARPIFNIANGANREAAFLSSFPALFSGSTDIRTQSQLGGVEFNGRYHVYTNERLHADFLLGFRYLNLTESTRFTDRLTPIVNNQLTFRGALVGAPNSLSDEDFFGTANQLYAGQFGGRVSWETGRFNFDAFGKLALGASTQHVNIDGSTTLITPAGNTIATGGILAQNSNIGSYNKTVFAIVPELGVNLGVEVIDHVRLRLGYSLLMWNSVARPTSQIDHNVNTGQVPSSPNFGRTTGPNAPTFQLNDEFFWNHFFNFGVEFRY